MKKFYLALLALMFIGATSFTGNDSPVEDGNLTAEGTELGGGGTLFPNTLYAITFVDAPNNFGRFSYYPESDVLQYDAGAAINVNMNTPYGMDYNPTDGLIYGILALPVTVDGAEGGGSRNFAIIDPFTGATTDLGPVVSAGAATNPSAMAISPDGTIYITFGSGEINTYDPGTGTATALGTIPSGGGSGLTYDYDNDRLIYASGTGPVTLTAIDPVTGANTTLFSFSVPGAGGACTAQAVQYVGNDKVISSSTFDCGIIYTVDLVTEATESLADPNPFDGSVKQFAYINPSTPIPFSCTDATLEVQSDLSVPYSTYELTNAPTNALVAVDAFVGGDDIHLYNYDEGTDNIFVEVPVIGSTPPGQFYAIDFNPVNNQIYILNDGPAGRSLYTIDIDAGTPVLLGDVPSAGGDLQPHAMTIGNDGAIYLAYKSGEIGVYDYASGDVLAFADVGGTIGAAGGVGLAYDWENNRLLHASNSPTVDVNAVDLTTAVVSPVISFSGSGVSTGQGFDYLGGDKVVASCTFGCDVIYTVDLGTGVITPLTTPSSDGFSTAIKDIMFIDFDVTIAPDAFDCGDIGANAVTIDVVDEAGNTYNCAVTVTVEDPNDFCGLSVDEFTADQIVMYPNPVSSELQIQWNMAEALQSVEIFDITGKLVMSVDMTRSPSLSLDVSELAGGLYMVKFQSASGTAVKRLLKQ